MWSGVKQEEEEAPAPAAVPAPSSRAPKKRNLDDIFAAAMRKKERDAKRNKPLRNDVYFPMQVFEAEAAAEKEGLQLVRSAGNASGFKGV